MIQHPFVKIVNVIGNPDVDGDSAVAQRLQALQGISEPFEVVLPNNPEGVSNRFLSLFKAYGVKTVVEGYMADQSQLSTVASEIKAVLYERPSWGRNQLIDVLQNVFEPYNIDFKKI